MDGQTLTPPLVTKTGWSFPTSGGEFLGVVDIHSPDPAVNKFLQPWPDGVNWRTAACGRDGLLCQNRPGVNLPVDVHVAVMDAVATRWSAATRVLPGLLRMKGSAICLPPC